MRSVQCQVVFAPPPATTLVGTLRVRVVDASRADASAIVVSEQAIENCSVTRAQDRATVTVGIPDSEPIQRLSVEAHLDINGSGETSVGDYRTMEHFPVTQEDFQSGDVVTIQVRAVS